MAIELIKTKVEKELQKQFEHPEPLYDNETNKEYYLRIMELKGKGFDISLLSEAEFRIYCRGNSELNSEDKVNAICTKPVTRSKKCQLC
jgi:hypothetical protein